MKLLIDFFPILLFFAAFKLADIYVATGVLIVTTVLQMMYLRFKNGKVETMQWLSLGMVVVFGGATLITRNEEFIKWKPTVLYWVMGTALVLGPWLFQKNFIKSLMGTQIALPDPVWYTLNWAWVGFFAVMGVLNLWVAFNFELDTWVSFKLFGGMGLMLAFIVAQALYLSRYLGDKVGDKTNNNGDPGISADGGSSSSSSANTSSGSSSDCSSSSDGGGGCD